ncbi:hypothetical protein BGZ73_004045 [Actinomortierella ambigua]|nr:hypothetical protein BGZ73_004045 [Actinomortierella ambigua]
MLPTSLAGLLTHPLVAPKIPRASLDLVLPRATDLEDESIEAFVTRRFGRGISDDLVSAMVHGIFAGDASKLSVRSTFGMLFHTEREYRSIVLGMIRGGSVAETAWDQALKERILAKMPDLKDFVAKTSIYSFQDGMQTLSDALERQLLATGRVKIHKGAKVDHLDFDLIKRSVSISIPHQPLLEADTVVAAIPPRQLSRLLPKPHHLLNYNESANVAVVNLVYPDCQQTFKTPGFGFLLPKSEDPAGKHKGLLGVVFDSCALPSQDKGEAYGMNLKLTAMMGGHLFEETLARHGLLPTSTKTKTIHQRGRSEKLTNLPLDDATMKALASNPQVRHFFEEAAKEAVRDKLQLHAEPSHVEVHFQWECIPQYRPGHCATMQKLDNILRRDYDGLLAVTGAGYLGVSVNDCIKNSRELAENLVAKLEEDTSGESTLVGQREAVTGLERSNFL